MGGTPHLVGSDGSTGEEIKRLRLHQAHRQHAGMHVHALDLIAERESEAPQRMRCLTRICLCVYMYIYERKIKILFIVVSK